MKIIHFFSYPGYGGSEKYALNISREAIREGNEALFIADSEGPLTEILNSESIEYKILTTNNVFLPLKYIRGIREFKKIAETYKPDVVHAHHLRENIIAGLANKSKAKYKLIRTIHRLDRFEAMGHRLTKSLVIRHTDCFVAPSKYAAGLLKEFGYPANRTRVVHNGTQKIETTNSQGSTVGMLSRLEEGKGVLEFVQSLPDNFNEFKVMIAGDGDKKTMLEEIIKKKNLTSVSLVGRVDNLGRFFSQIKILIHPSLNESTLPMSVIEALSTGREAIIFDIKSVKEFTVNGLIKIEPGNWRKLRETTSREITKPTFEKKDISDSFEDNFSSKNLWSAIKKLYQAPGL